MNEQQTHEEPVEIWERLQNRLNVLRNADRNLIDPATVAKKLEDRARVLRGRIGSGEPAGPQLSFLAFCHGSQRYGIPVSDIVEVQPFIDYALVPGAPSFICGVIHWRGAITSLIDLVKLFGIAESGLIDERAFLIVEAAGRRVGILAGEVEELGTVPLDQVKPVPELGAEVPLEWIAGVHDENRLILKMDEILQDPRLVDWGMSSGL